MTYIKGETIQLFQGNFIVENVYQLSDGYMQENELYYKDRVTLVDTLDSCNRLDFAISENN